MPRVLGTECTGYGVYLALEANEMINDSCMFGNWDTSEQGKSSTWRELESVNRMLKNSLSSIKCKTISLKTDNKNVETILSVGSRKCDLQDINIDIHNTCTEHDVSLSCYWIPRNKNKTADKISRLNDCDDWGVQT